MTAIVRLALLGALLVAASTASAAEPPRPVLGLSLGDPEPLAAVAGLPVTRVAEGAAADAMGVRVGDRLLAANGRPIATPEDLGRVMAALPADGALALSLSRDGNTIEVAGTLAPPRSAQDLEREQAQAQARLDRIAALPRDESAQVRRLLAAIAKLEDGLAAARAGFAQSYPSGELTLDVAIDIRSDAAAESARELAVPGAKPPGPAAQPPRADPPTP